MWQTLAFTMAWKRHLIEPISVRISCCGIACHSSPKTRRRLATFRGGGGRRCLRRLPKMSHTCSIGLAISAAVRNLLRKWHKRKCLSCSAVVTRGRPRRFRSRELPVCRIRERSLEIVVRWQPKYRATSLGVRPANSMPYARSRLVYDSVIFDLSRVSCKFLTQDCVSVLSLSILNKWVQTIKALTNTLLCELTILGFKTFGLYLNGNRRYDHITGRKW